MTSDELKQRARATWSAGDYDGIVEYIWSAGGDLVRRVGIGAGDEVLDVACGTGNATIPAAQSGARTVGLDLTPELLEGARRRAAASGVELELIEGDAEELPFDDQSFDVVLSTFGCMFAPSHEAAAAEIARVLRPGGRIGITAWTPDGSVGDFFATMSALAPPPPPDFTPPVLWGTPEHVSRLFDDHGLDLRFEQGAVEFRFESVGQAVDEYYEKFGPIVMLRSILEPQGRGAELREAIREGFAKWAGSADGRVEYPGEYLVTLGAKPA